MIISISGTPGTGKTEVAKTLGKLLGWKVIHLNDLAEKNQLCIGYDLKRKCKVVDIDALGEKIEKKRKKEKNLILEAHYAHELDSDLTIILRCHAGELRKRLKKKGYNKEKIKENLEAEIMEICRQEAWELGRKIVDVNTAGKKPEEMAREIRRVVNYLSLNPSDFRKWLPASWTQARSPQAQRTVPAPIYTPSVLHATGTRVAKNLQQSHFAIVGLPRVALSADSKPT